jgi:hypothetical protein
LFADVISTRARGLYDDVRTSHGAPYFETKRHEWTRNPWFADSAPLVAVPQLRVYARLPLYSRFVRAPGSFDWLNHPAQFRHTFPQLESLTL